jgi:hypothetical protein
LGNLVFGKVCQAARMASHLGVNRDPHSHTAPCPLPEEGKSATR